ITLVRDMGYALITDIRNCARAFAAMADYRALRERFLKPIEVRPSMPAERAAATAALAGGEPVLCEWEARPLLAAYGINSLAGTLATSADAAVAAAPAIRRPGAPPARSPAPP